jgi:lysophospholipase L1-like esterase
MLRGTFCYMQQESAMRVTLFFSLLIPAILFAADGGVIESFDAPRVSASPEKAHFEIVGGKDGKALKCAFDDGCSGKFVLTQLHGTPEWDKAAGFSFWVKGDGSEHWGGLEFIWNDDYGLRYDFCFPIDSTEWKKITVAWNDLIPNLPKAGSLPIDPAHGNAPSKFSSLWFGKFFFWRDYAGHSYVIDDMRLEPVIERDTQQYLPAAPNGGGLERVRAKIKAGKPITIVTAGDSLTDYNHWANKAVPNWPTLLKTALKEQFHCEATIVNPAIGGTQLRQGQITQTRWLKDTPAPDLVTVFYGGNDYADGMRGPMFEAAQADGVLRLRRATKGAADILLMTTAQGLEKWNQHAELAEATRKAAASTHAGLCDIYAIYDAIPPAERAELFCDDKVHMGRRGHAEIAKAVLDALTK